MFLDLVVEEVDVAAAQGYHQIAGLPVFAQVIFRVVERGRMCHDQPARAQVRQQHLGLYVARVFFARAVDVGYQYVVNAVNKGWIRGWQRNGWKTAAKKPVKNPDLWRRLTAAMEPHDVTFVWVKGHAGHELNERCDELATTAADGSNLDIDTGFNESDL